MKQRKENGKVFLTFNYNPYFSDDLKRYCGAKWHAETKEWVFDEEFEEKMNDLMLEEYGFSFRCNKKIIIEINAEDFYNKAERSIKIGKHDFAYRRRRDSAVELYFNGIILQGEFPKWGGSARYPDVALEETVRLRYTITEELYNTFSTEEKEKIDVIRKEEISKKESLLAKKEDLLKQLAEIEKKLEEI